MVGIALNLSGLFELPTPRFVGESDRASAFATGALAAFVATPCSVPFMGAALGASDCCGATDFHGLGARYFATLPAARLRTRSSEAPPPAGSMDGIASPNSSAANVVDRARASMGPGPSDQRGRDRAGAWSGAATRPGAVARRSTAGSRQQAASRGMLPATAAIALALGGILTIRPVGFSHAEVGPRAEKRLAALRGLGV